MPQIQPEELSINQEEQTGRLVGTVSEQEIMVSQVYPFRYFTGANCRLFIENILIDEAVAFQYVGQQPVIPLYPYDSCHHVRTARGKALVQGQILVNFVDEGYLFYVLENVKKGSFIGPVAPEHGATTEKESQEDKDAEDLNLTQALSLIKSGSKGSEIVNSRTKKFLNLETESHSNVMYHKTVFNMTLEFGEPGSPVHTFKVFQNCQFTGNTMQVDINSGEPVSESYGFIAKTHQ